MVGYNFVTVGRVWIKVEFPTRSCDLDETEAKKLQQISHLCKALLAIQDANDQRECAEEIFRIVRENPTKFKEIRQSGGLRSICRLLAYIKHSEAVIVLLKCITDLAGADEENCSEICRTSGMLNIVNTFDQTEDPQVKIEALKTLRRLSESFVCGEQMVRLGTLTFLSKFMRKCQEEDILFVAVDLLSSLVQHVENTDAVLLSSGIVDAILPLLLRINDINLHLYCIRCLTDMTLGSSRVLEYLRKEGHLDGTICLAFNLKTELQLQECYLALLHSIAANSREVREVLAESAIEPTLRRIKSGKISSELRQTCNHLLFLMKQTSTSDDCSNKENTSQLANQINPNEIQLTPLLKESRNGVVNKTVKPEVLWTQNRHSIALTVMVQNDTNIPEECISATESSIKFRYIEKNTEYAFNFTLYELIYPDSKQLRVTPNQIEIGFHKKSRGRWQRLLREKKKVYRQLRPDLEHYIDSDSESDSDSNEESETSNRPLEILRRKKARNRRMNIPKDFEPIVDYGAMAEPLPYVENEDSNSGEKMKDALDSNEPSDVELHDDREAFGMNYVDEFNPFGAM